MDLRLPGTRVALDPVHPSSGPGVLPLVNHGASIVKDPNRPARGERGRRSSDRLLALGLGTALSLTLLGGLALASTYGIGGTERCDACGAAREVRFAGLVRGAPNTSTSSSSAPCNGHDWRRRGCWRTLGGYSCYR